MSPKTRIQSDSHAACKPQPRKAEEFELLEHVMAAATHAQVRSSLDGEAYSLWRTSLGSDGLTKGKSIGECK